MKDLIIKSSSPVWQDVLSGLGNGFSEKIARDVQNEMRAEIVSEDPEINRVLSQILSNPGKCVRPIFMALVGELAGGEWESLKKAAMVIETIHQASLLHDDVIDGSEFRRGMPTLNARHSDKVSVLYGDFIFVTALFAANKIENPDAVEVVNRAVKRMIEGEIKDSMKTGIIDEGLYLNIIADKTAALFAASGELGAMLSGVDSAQRKWAAELGECLGIAFQIIDDSLDYNGNSVLMGKPSGMDLMTGNMTLPLIHALKGMKKEDVYKLLSSGDDSGEKIASLIRDNGGIEYSYGKALEYSQRSVEIIKKFDNDKMLGVFENLFNYLINRTF